MDGREYIIPVLDDTQRTNAKRLLALAQEQIGVPYQWQSEHWPFGGPKVESGASLDFSALLEEAKHV